MNQIYEHENYEIKINKMSDSVYIEFYDNNLYKTFSNTFLDIDIVTITGKSIDTFYTVMNTVFSALIDKDYEKSTLNIILFNKQIKLDIHHKYYIDLKFELELNLNKEDSSNDKNICFKKLEDKIKLLEIKNDQLTTQLTKLEDFIDNYMQVCIFKHYKMGYQFGHIPNIIVGISNPRIEIIFYKRDHLDVSSRYNNKNYLELRITLGSENSMLYLNFDPAFKIVKCDILELNMMIDYDPIFEKINLSKIPLPLSVKTLIIKKHKSISLPFFELPNLITLELIDCTFEFIYEKISHLKTLKNITIQRCNNFKERELLISKGYNFNVSHDL